MILIVEDSRIQRAKLKSFLLKNDFEVQEAENGLQAIEKIEEFDFELVMSDLLMPEMDGIGLLTTIKEKELDVPVVIFTADIQDSTKNRCEELGANDFLNKPLKPEELLSSIRRVLQK